jgi:hypothetical protein
VLGRWEKKKEKKRALGLKMTENMKILR